jgi:hypothetical protein
VVANLSVSVGFGFGEVAVGAAGRVARGRRGPPGPTPDRVAEQGECPRAVQIGEDVRRQQHDGRAAERGIPFDAGERMDEVRSDEYDVGGIEVDGQRQLGACEGGICQTLVMRCMSQALCDERAGSTSTADHEDPHRSTSMRVILVKSLRADNHSCFRGGGNPAVGAALRLARRD